VNLRGHSRGLDGRMVACAVALPSRQAYALQPLACPSQRANRLYCNVILIHYYGGGGFSIKAFNLF